MIFLVVFGGIALVLSFFYLLSSIQRYDTWHFAVGLLIVFGFITAYGVFNLPYWHHNADSQVATKTVSHQTKHEYASSSTAQSSAATRINPASQVINGKTAKQVNAEKSYTEKQITKQVTESFKPLGSVKYFSKTRIYQIQPTNENTINSLKVLELDPTQATHVQWPQLTKNLSEASANISQTLHGNYTVQLMSPNDQHKVLYSAENGKTVVDFVKQ